MSSVFGTEKDTPMAWPLLAMMEKNPCNRRMFPVWEGKATVIENSSMYETIRPLGTDMCIGATYSTKRRGEIGDPCGGPMETEEALLGEPWKTWVHVLSDKKEETQSTI